MDEECDVMEESLFLELENKDILESDYYDFLLQKNLFSTSPQVSTRELFSFCKDSDFFRDKLNHFRTEYIYPSEMHGIFHNIRVAMLSYYISVHLGLSLEEQELMIDASFYHDTGRINDIDDILHGNRSANKIDEIILDKDEKFRDVLKIVITCHSHEDKEMDKLIQNSELDFESTKLLACILKDTDALDRIRFDGLDPSYLRLDISKSLLNASAGLFFTSEAFRDRKKDSVPE